MRFVLGIAAVVLLVGCSANPKELAKYGDVSLEGKFLKSLVVKRSGPASQGLPECVAATVRNDSVSLGDAAGSFVGPYTRTYYSAGSVRESGGGSVIQYVSPDEAKVVAQGATSFNSGLATNVVRFTMTLQRDGQGRSYQFASIQQAQTDTGTMSNIGFTRVHVMTGGGSAKVLASLKGVVDDIESCVR
jgi:hypothetical protein